MYEVDHVLVFCREKAPEAALLEQAALVVGRRRQHPGQGTANACFFFANAMLELIWVENEAEARSPLVQPLGLWERGRWRENGTCPIGVAVRSAGGAAGPPPFATWDYAPPYVQPDAPIAMACNSGVILEPLLFAVPGRPESPDVAHPLASKRVTAVQVTVKDLAPMSLLRELAIPGLTIAAGDAHQLEIELGGGSEGGSLDCAPDLPLRLRW